MPNWCNNSIKLYNCDEPFDQVVKDYLTTETDEDTGDTQTILDFTKIIPYPKCIAETIHLWSGKKIDPEKIEEAKKRNLKECGYESFYDWSVKHWGTKWNCCDPFINELGMSFTTAWSPPTPVIEALATLLNKDIRMTYIEEGMSFVGEFYAYGNGTIVDNCYDIKDAPESLLEEVGYEEWEAV
jgi:hypothetical protein